ncbi:MAG TPA: lyase family protein, partial [Acidimicrobiales bacterium]|nr:lyase family protein [Acidimicrobiales bacterium]
MGIAEAQPAGSGGTRASGEASEPFVAPEPVTAQGSFTAEEWRLRALSPLDGRYGGQMEHYAALFSEQALMRQRFCVEVEWLEYLAALPEVTELGPLSPDENKALRAWAAAFGLADALAVKRAEARTNHDVKAVEYYLRQKLVSELGWPAGRADFVHFGATSEDVNNLAYARMVRSALAEAWLPAAEGLVEDVRAVAIEQAGQAMLARTHGQPATPTTLGKELAVFVARWERQLRSVRAVDVPGKWGGATGTLAAHAVAYPEVDWIVVARGFVSSLGFTWAPLTTQVEPHDWLAE